MKFGHLIFRKLCKFVANGCEILRLKCTKFDFGQGFAQDPAGSLQRSPDLLQLDLRCLLLREGSGRGVELEGRGEG